MSTKYAVEFIASGVVSEAEVSDEVVEEEGGLIVTVLDSGISGDDSTS